MSAEEAAALRAEADAYDALAKAKRMRADAIERSSPVPSDDAVLVTVAEASRVLGVSKRSVFAWIEQGAPSKRRGKFRRVSLDALRAWLDERGTR